MLLDTTNYYCNVRGKTFRFLGKKNVQIRRCTQTIRTTLVTDAKVISHFRISISQNDHTDRYMLFTGKATTDLRHVLHDVGIRKILS